MSINEAPYPHTGLTPAQQRDATTAIYGPAPGSTTIDLRNLTPEAVNALEAMMVQYHHQNAPVSAEFDLNKPPLRPYNPARHPFPKMIYHHERRSYQIVQNQAQLDYNLGRGWKTEPYPNELPADEPVLTEAEQREVAFFDSELNRKPPKK